MSWQGQGCNPQGGAAHQSGWSGVTGDARYPAHALVPYPKPRKHPLSGGTSFSSCLFHWVLLFFPAWMHRALQHRWLPAAPEILHPGALAGV